jgi:type IV pilus assembly protein PilV
MLKIGFRYLNGFTLIEVLISMVVLALGLLGLAAMQALALKDNRDAYFYSQANLLAYEMGDRINANSQYWREQSDDDKTLNPVPPAASEGNGCNSSGAPCTSAEMAAYDMYYWEESVRKTLPAPTTGNMVDIERSPCTEDTGNGFKDRATLCLIIRWSRMNQPSNTAFDPDITYKLEITPS